MTLRQRKMMQWLQASRRRTNWLQQTSSEPLPLNESAATSGQQRPSEAPGSKSRSEPRSSTVTAIAASLTLIGCASTPPSLPPAKPVRVPPAAAMVPCLVPTDLPTPDLPSLTAKLLETVEALAECAARQAELSEFVNVMGR